MANCTDRVNYRFLLYEAMLDIFEFLYHIKEQFHYYKCIFVFLLLVTLTHCEQSPLQYRNELS